MFGLKVHQIDAMHRCFEKYPQIELVIIYGSRARGNYKRGSDIDLTVVASTDQVHSLWMIENELDDLLLPYKIDLSLKSKLTSPELIAHIEKDGKVFYDRTTKLIMNEPPVEYGSRINSQPSAK